MRLNNTIKISALFLISILLTACGGGGGSGGGAVSSTLTFPLQSGYKTLAANGLTRTFTVSGSCSGSGSKSSTPAATPATFEGMAALSATSTLSMSLSNCNSLSTTVTTYVDNNYMPLGMNSVGVNYGVYLTPPAIPTSVTVGQTGSYGTMTLYADSTKATGHGTGVQSYAIEADSPTTAIVNLISKLYDTSGTLTATEQDRYRITATGDLSPISADLQYASGTHLVLTYNPPVTIGGTVSGLTGSVVLQDNGGDNLTVSANGSFTFPTKVVAYNVSVLTPPSGQFCAVMNGSGTATSNVTSVAVNCSNSSYVVQGGLTWMPITFAENIFDASDYCRASFNGLGQTGWRLPTQPELSALYSSGAMNGQGWSLGNGNTWSGTYDSGYNDVVNLTNGSIGIPDSGNQSSSGVTCVRPTSNTIGGTVSGLTGSVVLQDNGGDNITVSNGSFTFPSTVTSGNPFNVTVPTQPSGQSCSVTNGSGTATSKVTSVAVNCTNLPAGYVSQGGLTWMPVSSTPYTYDQAIALCGGTINGQTGWRLPTLAELSGVTTPPLSGYVTATGGLYGSGAMNGQGWTLGSTWSSTPSGAGTHVRVILLYGNVFANIDTSTYYVTCVR